MKHEKTKKMKKERIRILIVEDSKADAELILHYLRHAGYLTMSAVVDSAVSMTEALKKKWDVVISDNNMPGFSALGALRVFKDSGQNVPFILLSSALDTDLSRRVLKAGADECMSKDDISGLADAIADMMQKK